MSRVLGIVAEYNPFHNGHLYHLEKAKKDTDSNYTVAVISGNFTQRGGTSLVDKWSKAEAAVSAGVDLVIELPVLYATSSAENFAEGAVKILDSLKIVDSIAFGAETPDVQILDKCADVLYHEPKQYKTLLSHELKKGLSYPKARENALMMYLNDIRKFAKALSSPNNILGIEYLKALKKLKSPLEAFSIPRREVGHNDLEFNNHIASSTAIRNMIGNDGFSALSSLMPSASYSILMKNMKAGHIIPNISVFEKEILYTLRKMTPSQIAELPDVTEGLEFAIKNAANSCNTFHEFMNLVKTKRYTATRLQRILVYALLGITKKDLAMSRKLDPYARVLALNKRGKFLIAEIAKANPKLQIITSVKRFADDNSNKNLQFMLEKDIWATNVYTLGYLDDSSSNLDFTKKIVTL